MLNQRGFTALAARVLALRGALIGRSSLLDRRLLRSRTTSRIKPGAGPSVLFGRTSKSTEPLPNPRFKDLIFIHSGWLTTSQKQPACAETSRVDRPLLETMGVYVNDGLVFRHGVAAFANPGRRNRQASGASPIKFLSSLRLFMAISLSEFGARQSYRCLHTRNSSKSGVILRLTSPGKDRFGCALPTPMRPRSIPSTLPSISGVDISSTQTSLEIWLRPRAAKCVNAAPRKSSQSSSCYKVVMKFANPLHYTSQLTDTGLELTGNARQRGPSGQCCQDDRVGAGGRR